MINDITKELKDILDELKIPNEVGLYTPQPAPDLFCVVVPVSDTFSYTEDGPEAMISEATVELYSKTNYLSTAHDIMKAIAESDDLTLAGGEFIEKESDTGYYHYAISVQTTQQWEEDE